MYDLVYLALSGVQRNSNMKLQISVAMVVKWYSKVLAFKSLYANYICPNANKEKNSVETPEHIIVSSSFTSFGVRLDKGLASSQQGVCIFCTQSLIRKLNSLSHGNRLQFMQFRIIYFFGPLKLLVHVL